MSLKINNQIQNTLIFYLTSRLEVFEIRHNFKLNLISFLLPEEKFLNLSDKFENFWIDNWQKFKPKTNIYLLIAPQSGFTDTRIIYVWLRNWLEFNKLLTNKNLNSKKNLYIAKIKNQINLQNLSSILLEDLLQTTQNQNSQDLIYFKEPNIKKKS